MHKARLPHQSGLGDTVETFASSPRGVSKVDPAYFGYWSKEEVLRFLNDLIETESIGLRAFAAIGRAADLRVANLVLESELAQGAICVLLKKEIARRGGARTIRKTITAPMPMPKRSLQHTVAFAHDNQVKLADVIEGAVLNIFDSKLNAKLMYLLLLHRKQVELLDTLHPDAAAAS